jgi:hypothetical protein
VSRRRVDVAMSGRDILAAVAAVAVDPTCRTCGGPAQLDTDEQGHVLVAVEHRTDCRAARQG